MSRSSVKGTTVGIFKLFIERYFHPPQKIVVVLHALVQGVVFLDYRYITGMIKITPFIVTVDDDQSHPISFSYRKPASVEGNHSVAWIAHDNRVEGIGNM